MLSKEEKRQLKYRTHQPYLRKALDRLDYTKPTNVLELGIGEASSSILYEYARQHKTMSVTGLESKQVWLDKMKHYELPNYKFELCDWQNLNEYHRPYDLIFIDQEPWLARVNSFIFFKSCFRYCVIHDFSQLADRFPVILEHLKEFKLEHCTELFPTTAIITAPV